MKPGPLRWVTLFAFGVGTLIASSLTYQQMGPMYVKKTVTVTLKDGGQARFVFSAAQPHNEIVYAMKTHWMPELEAHPSAYVGQTADSPLDDYVARQWMKGIERHGFLVLLPVIAWVALRMRETRA